MADGGQRLARAAPWIISVVLAVALGMWAIGVFTALAVGVAMDGACGECGRDPDHEFASGVAGFVVGLGVPLAVAVVQAARGRRWWVPAMLAVALVTTPTMTAVAVSLAGRS